MTRAYFRIQEKHPICSKRASYFGNISWFASSTLKNLWKVSVAICKHFMIYRSCLISYFLSKVLRKPGDGRNRNLEIFWSTFPRKLQRCHYRIVKCTEKLEKLCKDLPTIVGQQKKFHNSENTFFAKNKCRKRKHKQSVVNFFQENTTL